VLFWRCCRFVVLFTGLVRLFEFHSTIVFVATINDNDKNMIVEHLQREMAAFERNNMSIAAKVYRNFASFNRDLIL
jgi:hypothetical protein